MDRLLRGRIQCAQSYIDGGEDLVMPPPPVDGGGIEDVC